MSGQPQQRRAIVLAAILLLAMMFLLAGGAALRESVTIDEVAHIGAGLSYWQKLDLRFNQEHPPLAKLLAALPLVASGVKADYSNVVWPTSKDFFPGYVGEWIFGDYVLTRWNEPIRTLAWARFPMLLLTIALGWLVFIMARRLGGDWGGLLCVAVYATTPLYLVFGPLVLTDIAITFFSLLALWAMSRLWDDPGEPNTRLMAWALAGAILTKFTAAILFFAFVGVSLSFRWWPAKAEGREWRRMRWRSMRRATFWAGVGVYVTYLVLSWNQPVSIPGLVGRSGGFAALGRILMPAWLFLCGLGWVVITGNRPTFILGHTYPHGIWFYFPVLVALKSTPGFLGLLAVAAGCASIARYFRWEAVIAKGSATLWRVVWVSVVVYSGLCILSHFDVSIRHFSTPLALLILMLAPLPNLLGRMRASLPQLGWILTGAVVLLAGSCLVTAVRTYPNYFPYLNPLASGSPGYSLVSDSNYDWNQALPAVKQFAEERNLPDVPIDIYGFANESAWVPRGRLWDCQAPAEQDAGKWAVVSANMILDAHNCSWLLQYPQKSLGGGSMIALQLPAAIPAAGTPGGPPPLEARRRFLGVSFEMREIFHYLEQHPEDIQKKLAEVIETERKNRAAKK